MANLYLIVEKISKLINIHLIFAQRIASTHVRVCIKILSYIYYHIYIYIAIYINQELLITLRRKTLTSMVSRIRYLVFLSTSPGTVSRTPARNYRLTPTCLIVPASPFSNPGVDTVYFERY